jgi:hypothetical protein
LPKKGSNGSLRSNAQKRSNQLIAHQTQGSVLDDLNISEQSRLELKLKADLHQDILKLIGKRRFTPPATGKAFRHTSAESE